MPSNGTKKAGGYYKDDGPGDNPPPDMAGIPDAEPKLEPLHRFANRPYAALGQNYVPRQEVAPYRESGTASWYGRRFHGVPTSSGERYDMYAMTAAHPTLPIPSYARVTNKANGKSVVVRINDRGPFHSKRIIDLSYTAAWKLGYTAKGSAQVEVEAIVPEGVTVLAANLPPTVDTKDTVARASIAAPVSTSQVQTANAQPDAPALPMPVTVADASAADQPAGTYLQLGAFTSNRNAESFRDYAKQELGSMTHQLFISQRNDGEREQFRLQLGPFSDATAAREMAERVSARLKLKPFLVQR
jgi:rare lipoprotein A